MRSERDLEVDEEEVERKCKCKRVLVPERSWVSGNGQDNAYCGPVE